MCISLALPDAPPFDDEITDLISGTLRAQRVYIDTVTPFWICGGTKGRISPKDLLR
jgi:hypothetical protein